MILTMSFDENVNNKNIQNNYTDDDSDLWCLCLTA